jgi:hypothetical protein
LQNFKEIYDFTGDYERLYHHLNGRGVHSIEHELRELSLAPIHRAFEALFNEELINRTESYISGKEEKLPEEMNSRMFSVVNKINEFAVQNIETSAVIEGIHNDIDSFRKLSELDSKVLKRKTCPKWYKEASRSFLFKNNKNANSKILIQLLMLHNIFQYSGLHNLFDNIDAYRVLNNTCRNFGIPEDKIHSTIYLIKSLTGKDKYHLWTEKDMAGTRKESRVIYVSDLFYGESIAAYLNINEHNGIKYFHKESFDWLLDWLFMLLSASYFKQKKTTEKTTLDKIKTYYSFFTDVKDKAEKSGYDILKLKSLMLGKNGKVRKARKPSQKKPAKKRMIKKN